MIFIDPDKVAERISRDWLAVARDISVELVSAEPVARRAIVERHEQHWRALKRTLAVVGHMKCWYCESKENRSDNAVDHFRPKGRIVEDPTHGGYWWLAFAYENYRFSCTFCNSRRRDVDAGTTGGKHDHFPLEPSGVRARSPDDALTLEKPMLLDPCRARDVMILWFDDGGNTTIHPDFEALETCVRRVEVSRDIYHLDHADIVVVRRRVYREVQKLADRIDGAFVAMTDADPEAQELFEGLLQQLRRRLDDEAEYAATARCAVRGLRATSGAAQALLERL